MKSFFAKVLGSVLFIALLVSCSTNVLGDKSYDEVTSQTVTQPQDQADAGYNEITGVPSKAVQSVGDTWVTYYIAKKGYLQVDFTAVSGTKYEISWTDKYGYIGTRPAVVIDMRLWNSTGGTIQGTKQYNKTSDGNTTPDPYTHTATYSGKHIVRFDEYGTAAGNFQVKIKVVGSSSVSVSSTPSSTPSSTASSSVSTEDGTSAAKAFTLTLGTTLNKTTTATSQSVWFKFASTAGTVYTVTPIDKSVNSSFTGVNKYYGYKSNSTTAIKIGGYSYIYSTDATRTMTAVDGTTYIKAVSTTKGTFSLVVTGGTPPSSSSVSTSTSSVNSEVAVAYKRYGSATDKVVTPTHGVLLVGGAGKAPGSFEWMKTKANGGDFVLLTNYAIDAVMDGDCAIFLSKGFNSVTVLQVDSKAKANTNFVYNYLIKAEAIFLDGGNQTAYYDNWNDTQVEQGIDYAVNTRGAVIGGTSAGCHAMGKLLHTPRGPASGVDSVQSSDVLTGGPYINVGGLSDGQSLNSTNYTTTAYDIKLAGSYGFNMSDNFLNIPLMANIITDTHWSKRDRMGRSIAMLARAIVEGARPLATVRFIAVDQVTAAAISADGSVKIFGEDKGVNGGLEGNVYFFKPTTAPAAGKIVKGTPMTWANAGTLYKVIGTSAGSNTFNLNTWTGTGGTSYNFSVSNGAITPSPTTIQTGN
jgi:cyanophycinase-like exopeptidase